MNSVDVWRTYSLTVKRAIFFAKGSEFLSQTQICNLLSSPPVSVNLRYFKFRLILSNIIYSLKNERSTILGCKDIGIRKFEYVAETQILYVTYRVTFQLLDFIFQLQYFFIKFCIDQSCEFLFTLKEDLP